MKSKISLIVLFVVIASVVFAQKKKVETITENDLKAHLEFVASDFMMGRDFNTLTPGLEITANYLKAQCMKMGLKPGGEDYFQAVDMVSIKPDYRKTYFKLVAKNGGDNYINKNIFSMGGTSENSMLEGDIVFAGYGWYNEETKYNDTEGLNIKDKIVVIMTRNLELAKDGKEADTSIEMKKMQKAMMGGAKALVMVPDPTNPNPEFVESVRKYASGGTFSLVGAKSRNFMPIQLVFGTEDLANNILKESGKTLAQLQQEINDSGKPNSFEIKNFSAEIKLAKRELKVDGKNVIAVIEGSDPVLKNECVVFTAHYDHLGVDGEEVYNGADDNGTGTVALLEIAEAFQSMKKKPKRSIVFAWVTAEEKGLIGSNYYSQNPVIPLEKTLVNINLDMVGRSAATEPEKGADMSKQLAGPNGLYIVSGKQSTELMEISNEICADLGLVPNDELSAAFLTRSDYYHFYKNGIPVLGLSTGMHDDYHKTTDELDKIDYAKMKRIAQYCFLVANKVANQNDRIVVDKSVKK